MRRYTRLLLRYARVLTGKDFATPDALRQYLSDHPKADKSKHKVVERLKGNRDNQESAAKKSMRSLNKTHPEVGAFIAKHLGGESTYRDSKNELKRHEAATDKVLKSTGKSRKDLEKFKSNLPPADKGAISKAIKSWMGFKTNFLNNFIEHSKDPEEKEGLKQTLRTLKSQSEELSDLMAAKMMADKYGKLRGPKKGPSGKKAALRTVLTYILEHP